MGMLLWLAATRVLTARPDTVHTEGVEIGPRPVTQITQTTATCFTLTTTRGKTFTVSIGGEGRISVYIKRNGMKGLAMGRHFFADTTGDAFLKAIEAYKAADIKAALRALLCELI